MLKLIFPIYNQFMQMKFKAILGKGLNEGYMAKPRGKVKRAGFDETSDYEGPEGKYHDEWAAPKRRRAGSCRNS